ncbi:MAG: hypothetical protein JRJ26_19990 [Deltaproteobacteria bacterium]|nr:hypothetical protein [Deltaproteobacteria bacterium]
MEEPIMLLDQVRRHIEKGRTDLAVADTRSRNTRDVRDAAFHLRWADLCEELGLIDDLILELNLALRDRHGDVAIHRRLAEIHRDSGNLEKAARKWRDVLELQPEVSDHHVALGEVLEEMREYEKAAEVYRLGFERTGDPVLKAHLKALAFVSEETAEPGSAEQGSDDWIPTDSQVVRFMDLFAGREGVYARQWVSPTGESGYTLIREPFTMAVAKNHLMGNQTVGIYPLRMDNTVCFIAFDIDIARYFLAKAMTSKKLWDRADARAQAVARKIVDLGAAHEIPIYIEDSGFKGRHCWILVDPPVPGRIARRFALLLLQQIGRPPSELQIEAFPKQAFVAEGGVGNLIKVPLGVHRKSGRRALFVDGDGRPFPNQFGFLEQIRKVSKQGIYEFIQRFQAVQGTGIQVARETPARRPEGETEDRKGEKPEAGPPPVPEQYDLERDAEFQYLISRCHVLRAIVEKINQEGEIGNEERIVLTHSVGLLKNGPEAVNVLLARCANVDASFFLKSRLRGNPISCPKIRSRVGAITSRVACNCKFDPKTTLYPSPLRHVQEMDPAKSTSLVGQTVDSLQFQQMLQEYVKARKQVRELEILIQAYERRLEEFFSRAGVESVQTPMGTLKRVRKEGEKTVYNLEI